MHHELVKERDLLPLSFQPPLPVLPTFTVRSRVNSSSADRKVIVYDNEDEVEVINNNDIEMNKKQLVDKENTSLDRTDSNTSIITHHEDMIFQYEFNITKFKTNLDALNAGVDMNRNRNKHLRTGRPDLNNLFERAKVICQVEKISRVGVLVCGPASLVNDVFDRCRQSQMSIDPNTIRFDCHREVFDF